MLREPLLDVDPFAGIEALDDLKAISTILTAFSLLDDEQRKSLPDMENFYRFISKFLNKPLDDIRYLSKLGNQLLVEIQNDIKKKEALAKEEAKAKKKTRANSKNKSKK